jgi:hypothetical protein
MEQLWVSPVYGHWGPGRGHRHGGNPLKTKAEIAHGAERNVAGVAPDKRATNAE